MPADLRLIRVKGLQIQEAALTGEAIPVEKTAAPVAPSAALADRASIACSGTLVTYGRGAGIVVATGDATEIGRIGAMLAEVETVTTPLLRQMARFGRGLSAAIVGLAALTFGFGVLVRDCAADAMFLAAVGLAVAAILEGLPAVMTVQTVVAGRQVYEVSGAGYAPSGGFARDGATIAPADHPLLMTVTRAAMLCSDATLREEGGTSAVRAIPPRALS